MIYVDHLSPTDKHPIPFRKMTLRPGRTHLCSNRDWEMLTKYINLKLKLIHNHKLKNEIDKRSNMIHVLITFPS